MKFLIVDDEEDIREVLSMMIQSNYDVQILQAVNGEHAIEMLQTEGPFDLVFSDLNMPKKNGVEVYKELRQVSPQTPFILITTEDKVFKTHIPQPTFYEFIDKPFTEDDLTKTIELVFSKKQIPTQKESYIPVSIDILRRVEYAGVSLYIRLNNSQYIKVLRENVAFNDMELVRFKNKKVSHLYIELLDFKIFISQFRKNVFSKAEWDKIDINEALGHLETDWKMIVEANKHFGWSESLSQLAKENISKTLAVMNQNAQLKKVVQKLKMDNMKNELPPHCYTLVFFTTSLLKELAWNSPSTVQKMTFACLLHDMDLTEVMFSNKLDLIEKNKLSSEINQQANYLIYNHTLQAAEFVHRWSGCPSDVDKIIVQHHEKFDGTGFPHKLNFLNIYPLAAVFIICEDMIYRKIYHPEENLKDYLISKESYYNHGDVKKIYAAALKMAETIG